ncbi:MAG: hypothetical protein RLZZ419_759 [Pseudomonadota bacterium]|jgi:DnaJ-class molecular chaperone
MRLVPRHILRASQNESYDHYKNRANAKKGHSFEERLDALRDNIDLCFAILDLDVMASPSEIKAAFKKKMSGYHPDKVSGLGDKLKQVAEEETKLINITYNVLKKTWLYIIIIIGYFNTQRMRLAKSRHWK